MNAALVDRVFADLRACRITEYEALGLIATIRAGGNPYEAAS